MKPLIITLTLAWLAAAGWSSTIGTVGLEDLTIAEHADRDFNDIELATTGISFHTIGDWTFTPAPGYHETPFPGPAKYFDYGVADGNAIMITFLSAESAWADQPIIRLDAGAWMPLNLTIPTVVLTNPGALIYFGLTRPDQQSMYSVPGWNPDQVSHAVTTGPGVSETPEPAMGLGVALMLLGIVIGAKVKK